jgi:hypothetical protein
VDTIVSVTAIGVLPDGLRESVRARLWLSDEDVS